MRKTVLLYGLLGGVLIAGLRLTEYRFLVVERSLGIYGGLVAALFAGLGIWLGVRLTQPKQTVVVSEQLPAEVDHARIAAMRITPREHEILTLMAEGMSNREIAGKLFLSENTVKTHSSRLFEKLNARRRTQAVQIAKRAGLIV